jgi:hypothetical protein
MAYEAIDDLLKQGLLGRLEGDAACPALSFLSQKRHGHFSIMPHGNQSRMGLLIRWLQRLEAAIKEKLGRQALGNGMLRIREVEPKLHGGARMTQICSKEGGKGLHRRPYQAKAPPSILHKGPEPFLIRGR